MNIDVAPFELRFSQLRRYCEVHFSGHKYYRSIELQRLEISPKRTGYVALLNTSEGVLDVLSEPHLGIDRRWCENDPSVANYSLGKIEPIAMERTVLETGREGVDAQVAFTDSAGRRVEVTIRTADSGPPKTRRLFVPSSPKPKAALLWFLYVFEFAPLRQFDTIEVSIDGQTMTPKMWPWPLGIRRHIQGRYANDISFFAFNPPRSRPLATIDDTAGWNRSESGAIRDWSQTENGHRVSVEFEPPIPTIPISGAATVGKGKFEIYVDSIRVGKGKYRVTPEGDGKTTVELTEVDQYWIPPEKDLSVWLLQGYHRLKAGRKRRWNWKGVFISDNDGVGCQSEWELTQK